MGEERAGGVGRGRAFLLQSINPEAAPAPGRSSLGPRVNPQNTSTPSANERGRYRDEPNRSRASSETPRELADFQSRLRIEDERSEPTTSGVGSGRGFLLQHAGTVAEPKFLKRSAYRTPSPEAREAESDDESRPPVIKKGKEGVSDTSVTNYMRLDVDEDRGIHTYDVEFDPPQEVRNHKITMLKKHRSKIYKGCVFNGNVLCLPIKLPDRITRFVSYHPVDDSPVELQIIYKKKKPFSEMPSLFNVLFKQIMTEMNMVDFGRKYFNPKAAHNIEGYHLEIWPGYVTSVMDLEGGLMLNLDISHRVLRSESILDHLRQLQRMHRDQWAEIFKKDIIGQSVLTHYNYKIYTIEDIDFKMSPKSTFDKGGKEISFIEYYKNCYGINIKEANQPLLIVKFKKEDKKRNTDKTDRTIRLIPELCCLTGLTDEMRNDFKLMTKVTSCTSSTPESRLRAVKKFISNINTNQGARDILTEWGISINPRPVEVKSRVLEPEKVIFGNDKIHWPKNADWKQAVMKYPVLQPIDIENWAILHVAKDTKYTMNLVESMMACTQSMGIRVSRPEVICLKADTIPCYVQTLNSVIHNDLDIVVCICSTMRDDRYAAIKRVCCVDNAIPSQVINSQTLGKKNADRIIKNIVLQMNCKLGGSLWTVSIPLQNSMFVGIDTYHSTLSNYNSVTALVASYNAHLTKWYSSVTIQRPGQEMSDNLQYAFSKALKQYHKFNNQYPSKIFIYRDGVGNDQLSVIENFEVGQLEACFKKIDPSYKPSLTVIVVQKRIMTRLYRPTPARNGNSELENPLPGTVVDHTIVKKHLYDFFLVSHTSARGVALPTHYIVVKDTSGLTPDQVQKLSYKLCHLYFNFSGTIRNPAPCQYAHKLCGLVGESIKQDIHHTLSDKLFYL